MATRYLVAMDHVDLHAKKVMRKYAQNRPLGDIERKYQVTPAQPLLSCHSAASTPVAQSYRPKSSAHVIEQQQQRIHDLSSRSRNVNSAPASRRVRSGVTYSSTDNYEPQTPTINVSVQGRPATSLSQTSKKERPSARVQRNRPKTTGQLKRSKVTREFMVVKVDPDLLMSSRRRKELTSRIREQWACENHDLSGGQFVRGQNQLPGLGGVDSPRTSGQWLTFGGSSQADSHGLIDAFATLSGDGQSYNIDGSSGSRVAQQLERGGRIRIGVNGSLSVAREKSLEEEQEDSSSQDEPKAKPVPLCWMDQVSSQESRILRARSPPKVVPKPVLCETYPVVFKKLISSGVHRPKLACSQPSPAIPGSVRPPSTTPVSQKLQESEPNSDRLGGGLNRNAKVTPAETISGGTSRTGGYNITVPLKDSVKVEDNHSSTDSDQQPSVTRSSGRPKALSAKKPLKLPGMTSRSGYQETVTGGKPLKVKPSPASFQVYTSPDPELSINVSGSKADIVSPSLSAGIKKDVSSGGRISVRGVSSASSTGVPAQQPLQPEFIHFTTGLISPNIQRHSKSTADSNFVISKVKEHNQREVSFDLSSAKQPSVQADTADFDSNAGEVLKRTNTPVSPEPAASLEPSADDPLHDAESFAISIPTAESVNGERYSSIAEDKRSQSPSIWGIEDPIPDWGGPGIALSETTPDTQFDSHFEEITTLMRESLAMSNQSDQSDSSSSSHTEDKAEDHSTTNSSVVGKQRLSVRFECDTKPSEFEDPSGPSNGLSPKVGDLLSGPRQPDALDASVEVRRLRQQIRQDLVKQQAETEDDIQYLRLKQEKRFT